jgi:hypothetical protein
MLAKVLPCGKCRANMEAMLLQTPLSANHMSSRESFSRWVFDFHQRLNADLSKPEYTLDFEHTKEQFEVFRAACTSGTAGETGCSETLGNQVKTKCLISIVPFDHPEQASLRIDNACSALTQSP